MRTSVVVLCRATGAYWRRDGAAACDDTSHTHDEFETHLHLDPVTFPDGAAVVGVSFDERAPYERDRHPDFGLYLDERWSPPWPHAHVDWPDFGLPADEGAFVDALHDLLARARVGEVVELGCLGGHGRTGTALACVAVLSGVPADSAVDWVRDAYCAGAVETPDQAAFVANLRV